MLLSEHSQDIHLTVSHRCGSNKACAYEMIVGRKNSCRTSRTSTAFRL